MNRGSQIKGKELEEAFRELFRSVLIELGFQIIKDRKQYSGSQFGRDLHFKWILSSGEEVSWFFECKNYTSPPGVNDVFPKLIQAKHSAHKIDCWVLVSPHVDVSNEVDELIEKEKDNFPFKILFWTPEYGIKELLSAYPKIYEWIYGESPPDISEERRKQILEKWRKIIEESSKEMSFDFETYREKLLADIVKRTRHLILQDKLLPIYVREVDGSSSPYDRINILDYFDRNDKFILLGEPGIGKTTALQLIAKKQLDKGRNVVLCSLKGYSGEGIFERVYSQINKYQRISERKLRLELQNGSFILLFDGLDEAMDYNQAVRDLNKFLMEYGANAIVISCRTGEYRNNLSGIDKKVEIQRYDIMEVEEFLLKNGFSDFIESLHKHPDSGYLMSLCANPFFLTMLLELFYNNSEIPKNVAEIVRQFIENRLIKDYKEGRSKFSPSAKMNAFSELAFYMYKDQVRLSIPRVEAENVIRRVLKSEGYRGKEIDEIFEDLINSGLLIDDFDEIYFMHKIIHEVFIALYFEKLLDEGQDISEFANFYKWDESIYYLAQITKHPNKVISSVLKYDLKLAAKCALHSKIDKELRNEIIERIKAKMKSNIDAEVLELIDFIGEFQIKDLKDLLTDFMRSGDQSKQYRASIALGKLNDRSVIPELIEILKRSDRITQSHVMRALVNLRAKEVVDLIPSLIERNIKRFGDSYVNFDFLFDALIKLEAYDIFPKIKHFLESDNEHLIRGVLRVCGELKIRESIESLIKFLGDSRPAIREEAGRALGKIGDDRIIDVLLEKLKDADENLICGIIFALGELKAVQAVDRILSYSNHENKGIRKAVVEALGKIGKEDLVDHILNFLKDPDRDVRNQAALSLLRLVEHNKAEKLESKLWKIFDEIEDEERMDYVLSLICHIGTEKSRDRLFNLLQLPSKQRYIILDELIRIDKEFIRSKLLDLLNDKDNHFKLCVISKIGELGVKEAIPQLFELLKEGDEMVSKWARSALVRLNAREIIPDAIDLFRKTDNEELKAELIDLFISFRVKDVKDDIIALLESSNRRLVLMALLYLERLEISEAIPKVAELARSNLEFRYSALRAIGSIDCDESRETLIQFLSEFDKKYQKYIIEFLGKIGNKETIPTISEYLSSEDEEIRNAAYYAIKSIKRRLNLPKTES